MKPIDEANRDVADETGIARVFVCRDPATGEPRAVRPDEIENLDRSANLFDLRSVPVVWWSRYVAAREQYRALEHDFYTMPRVHVTWSARLSITEAQT